MLKTARDADAKPANAQSMWRGRLLIVAAALLWSTGGLFAKSPWFDGWPAEMRGLMLAFWRSLFAALVLVPWVRRPQWHRGLPTMCLSFALMVWAFLSAMVHGPAANAIWLQYLAPAWVMLAGVCWFGERVTPPDLRMFGCCLAGVMLILIMELSGGSALRATLLGILAGVAFAGVVLHLRILRVLDSAWLMMLNQAATVLLLLPWVWGQKWEAESMGVPLQTYVVLVLFGAVQIGLPYILFARGLRTVSSPEASIITLLEPILLPVWVYLAWHNHAGYQAPPWWTWAGGGMILCGLLVRYWPTTTSELAR
ncbi:MAG: EamA family transporter [Pirellulaceae bacterium]|nr:EamA family transporter [Pirellulaceae bacterium]